jgi:hypothetical protein
VTRCDPNFDYDAKMHQWSKNLMKRSVNEILSSLELRIPVARRVARCHPAPARHTGLEVGGGAEMPIMPDTAVLAACAHDRADQGARDHALRVGAFG